MEFIWKIENFSDLNETLQSPLFISHSNKWELIINPFTRENVHPTPVFTSVSDGVGIKLQLLENENRVVFHCSFALLDCEGLPLAYKEVKLLFGFRRLNGLFPNAYYCLSKRDDIFGARKTEFLPNDILTVQCRIWRTVAELSEPLLIFARSRVEIPEVIKKFDFNIARKSLFKKNNILEHAEPIMDDREFLMLKVFLNNENILQVESKVSMFKCEMIANIFLLNSVYLIKNSFCMVNFNKRGEVCALDTQISRNVIDNGLSDTDTLTLHFVCSFSKNVTLNRIVDQTEMPKAISASNQISEASVSADKAEINQLHLPNTIIQDLQGLLEKGVLSDFEFRVGDRVFPVHKAILTARSQVFRAMFTSKMKEKEDNFVDIPDLDADTLQRLLQFIYSDKFDEDMGWERASSLYAAADKYTLEPLKQGCSSVLKSGLSASNVLEVLSLADMHNDQGLKSATLDFISLNEKKVVCTELWKEFEEENAKLALETFHKLFLKKMNG